MADAVAEDPSYPPVKGRLDSKTSIEKEGLKAENVYGLPLTGGKRGGLAVDVADTGANCYGNGCWNWSIFLLIGDRNFALL